MTSDTRRSRPCSPLDTRNLEGDGAPAGKLGSDDLRFGTRRFLAHAGWSVFVSNDLWAFTGL